MSHRSAVPTAVLRCFASERLHDASVPATVCEACGLPLRVDLDLVAAPKRCIRTDVASLWRYARQLPAAASSAITLGEGWTPLSTSASGWIKDEARALQLMQRSERQLRLDLDAHRPQDQHVVRLVEEISLGITRDQRELSDLWCRLIMPITIQTFEGFKEGGLDVLGDHPDDLPPEYRRWLDVGFNMSALEFVRDQKMRTEVYDAIQGVFADYDLVVGPTLACLPVDNADDGNTVGPTEINGVEVDPLIGWCPTYLINYTGTPRRVDPGRHVRRRGYRSGCRSSAADMPTRRARRQRDLRAAPTMGGHVRASCWRGSRGGSGRAGSRSSSWNSGPAHCEQPGRAVTNDGERGPGPARLPAWANLRIHCRGSVRTLIESAP